MTTQAWQSNRIFFQTKADKRMPKLDALLKEIGSVRSRSGRQSTTGLRNALEILAAQTGTKVRTVKAS